MRVSAQQSAYVLGDRRLHRLSHRRATSLTATPCSDRRRARRRLRDESRPRKRGRAAGRATLSQVRRSAPSAWLRRLPRERAVIVDLAADDCVAA
jgi:hypothetical protein